MGLLSEIVKSSEALRYHSKSAEIAGQNLAHVNDKDYARQRVLAREGVMHSRSSVRGGCRCRAPSTGTPREVFFYVSLRIP